MKVYVKFAVDYIIGNQDVEFIYCQSLMELAVKLLWLAAKGADVRIHQDKWWDI
jgi:hypothetical protein